MLQATQFADFQVDDYGDEDDLPRISSSKVHSTLLSLASAPYLDLSVPLVLQITEALAAVCEEECAEVAAQAAGAAVIQKGGGKQEAAEAAAAVARDSGDR